MRKKTIASLAAIARDLYEDHADAFDETRQNPWRGWARVIEKLPPAGEPISVIDAGCGNGRLAIHLRESRSISYTGIDSSAAMLAHARARLGESSRLLQRELTSPDALADLEPATLVAAMGLMHHLPGRALRRDFVTRLARLVAPGGLLAISIWLYARHERFQKKLVDWSARPEIDPRDLEPGDQLLTFGGGALRYCHAFDDQELIELAQAAEGLALADEFDADTANRYLLFVRGR